MFLIISNPNGTYSLKFSPQLLGLPITEITATFIRSMLDILTETIEGLGEFDNLDILYSVTFRKINDFFSAWQHMIIQDMLAQKDLQLNSDIFYLTVKFLEKVSVGFCLAAIKSRTEKLDLFDFSDLHNITARDALNTTLTGIHAKYAEQGVYHKWDVLRAMRQCRVLAKLVKKQGGSEELVAELKALRKQLNDLFEMRKAPEGSLEGLFAAIKSKRAGYTPADAVPFWVRSDRTLKLILRTLLLLAVAAYIAGHICFPPLVVFSGLAVCGLTLAIICRRILKWIIRSTYYGRPFLSWDQIRRGLYNLFLSIINIFSLHGYAGSIGSLVDANQEVNIVLKVILRAKKIVYNIGYNAISLIGEFLDIKSSSQKLAEELSDHAPIARSVPTELSFGQKIGAVFLSLYMMLSWSLSEKKKFSSDAGNIADEKASIKEIFFPWLKFCAGLFKGIFTRKKPRVITVQQERPHREQACHSSVFIEQSSNSATTDAINNICNEYISAWQQRQPDGKKIKLPSGVRKIQAILKSNKSAAQKTEKVANVLKKKIAKAEAQDRDPSSYAIKHSVTPKESLECYHAIQKALQVPELQQAVRHDNYPPEISAVS